MRVMIAGGGTGGHLFPGIALAEELTRRDSNSEIVFVGTERGIETRAVPRSGYRLELLPVSGLRGKGIWGLLKGLSRLPIALWRAVALVRRVSPDVAVSVGGYAAGPAVLAAKLLRIPCVVMEQNAVPGFTNRVLGRLADRVFASMPTTGFPASRVTVLGNPVRADLLAVRSAPYEPKQPLNILVFGGSQGARALNNMWMQMAPQLPVLGWRVVHQTGAVDVERVAECYRSAGVDAEVTAFIDDMAAAYRQADLVVCRSGASTIAELTVCGRPSILVPFPYAVDDHQTANARVLEDLGASVCLPETDLTADKLTETIAALNAQRLSAMAAAAHADGKPEAVGNIAEALVEVARV